MERGKPAARRPSRHPDRSAQIRARFPRIPDQRRNLISTVTCGSLWTGRGLRAASVNAHRQCRGTNVYHFPISNSVLEWSSPLLSSPGRRACQSDESISAFRTDLFAPARSAAGGGSQGRKAVSLCCHARSAPPLTRRDSAAKVAEDEVVKMGSELLNREIIVECHALRWAVRR